MANDASDMLAIRDALDDVKTLLDGLAMIARTLELPAQNVVGKLVALAANRLEDAAGIVHEATAHLGPQEGSQCAS